MKRRVVRAFLAGVISIAVAIAGAGGTCLWKYYDLSQQCLVSWNSPVVKMEGVSRASDDYKLGEIHPCKGKVYFSINQESGVAGTKYKVEYKRKYSRDKYKSIGTFTCKKNKIWAAQKLLFKAPNSATTYLIKITRMNNHNKTGKIKYKYTFR